MRWILPIWILSVGCVTAPERPQPKDADCIGMTLGEAIKFLEFKFDDSGIIYEPPGVARGVKGLTGDGITVSLYFERYETPGYRHDLTYKDVRDFPVIGISRRLKEGWSVNGKVIWYYHD